MKGLQGEVAKVKKDMKAMRMGPVLGMSDDLKKFTEDEQRQHIRSNHTVYDTRCELCVQTRGLARRPKHFEEETVNFDYATVKNKDGTSVHT